MSPSAPAAADTPDHAPAPAAGPAVAVALVDRYAKTAAGHAEVRSRSLALSRQARNLLLIVDASRPAGDWTAMVQGCGQHELQSLVSAGLVAGPVVPPAHASMAAGGAAALARAAPPAQAPQALPGSAAGSLAGLPARPLPLVLAQLGYRTLYDRITAMARPQLGLIKGYRLILELERCSGPAEIRALALRFVELVRDADGEAAALRAAELLSAPE